MIKTFFKLHKAALKAKGLRDAFEDSESGEFCGTCARHIMVGSVPPLYLNNGLRFPIIPACLVDLTCL
jgi:hypothetical protein